jgi:hypothetical protein
LDGPAAEILVDFDSGYDFDNPQRSECINRYHGLVGRGLTD